MKLEKNVDFFQLLDEVPVFSPGESHGWRSLVGYSPWGFKEYFIGVSFNQLVDDLAEFLHVLIDVLPAGCFFLMDGY